MHAAFTVYVSDHQSDSCRVTNYRVLGLGQRVASGVLTAQKRLLPAYTLQEQCTNDQPGGWHLLCQLCKSRLTLPAIAPDAHPFHPDHAGRMHCHILSALAVES